MINLHYILDTYAWIEYFIGSTKGTRVKKILENARNTFTTLECGIAELYEWCIKEKIDFSRLFNIVRSLSSIEPVSLNNWIEAAKIKIERRQHVRDFGLMDAIILANQKEFKCRIVTGDKHFKILRNIEFLQ